MPELGDRADPLSDFSSLLSPLLLPSLMARLVLVALCALVAVSAASVAPASRTLVVLDDEAEAPPLVSYLEKELGHEVVLRSASEGEPLQKYGEFQFDSVVFLCDKADELHPSFAADALASFARVGGGNLVVAAAAAPELRALANEFGVDFGGERVVDYVRNAGAPERVLTRAAAVGPTAALGEGDAGEAEFTGVAHAFRADSPHVQPVLDAEATAVDPEEAGDGAPRPPPRLVSAVQLPSNARALFAGGAGLVGGAGPLARRAVGWAVQGSGVLRLTRFVHRKQGSPSYDSPARYQINDVIEVAADLELDGKPYAASDVQLELVMMDPYVRVNLKHNGKGTFVARERLPDTFGVYTVRLAYARGSLSAVRHEERINVAVPRHDSYPRFLLAAYPYYASSFSILGAFFVFSVTFLYTS